MPPTLFCASPTHHYYVLAFPFYKWGNWGTENLGNFPKVTCLVRSWSLGSKPPSRHHSLPRVHTQWARSKEHMQGTVRESGGENGQRDPPPPGDSLHPAVSVLWWRNTQKTNKEQSLGRSTKTSVTEQRVIKWQENDHREQKLQILAGTSLSTHSA